MYEYFALKKYMKSKVGFTLVEIMVVIVVMSILVAVGVVIYGAKTDKAEKEVCLANQDMLYRVIDDCLMQYIYLDGNSSSETTSDLMRSSGNIKNLIDTLNFTIRYEEKENKTTHQKTVTVTALPDSKETTRGVFSLFNRNYKNIYNSCPNKTLAGAEFLKQVFFAGQLPYCPTLIGEADVDGCSVKASGIKVVFKLDEDGDPYVYSVGCATHGTTTYHAP